MNSAYLLREAELTTFLNGALASDKTAAAYLAAHEEGQSDWMLGHVTDMATSSDAGPVVYVTPHAGEAQFAYERLARVGYTGNQDVKLRLVEEEDDDYEMGGNGSYKTGHLVFCAYDTMPWDDLPARYVVIVDVELYCTTAGEMFFARLLEKCSNDDDSKDSDDDDSNSNSNSSDGSVLTVLCVAPRVSTRTTHALERAIPEGVTVIEVPDNRPPLQPEVVVEQEQFDDAVKQAVADHASARAEHQQHPGVALVLTNLDRLEDHLSRNQVPILQHARQLRTPVPDPTVLLVRQELGFAGVCPQLRLVFSGQHRRAWVYHAGTSHLRQENRPLTFWGVRKEEEWIRKTQRRPALIRYVVGGGRRTAQGQLRGSFDRGDVDPAGPAWQGDLLATLLQMADRWPQRPMAEWPIRAPPDPHMAAEGLRRLAMMGALVQPQPDSVQTTGRGERMLFLYAHLPGVDFFRDQYLQVDVCCLLAVAGSLASVPARRVLVLMALFVQLLRQSGPLLRVADVRGQRLFRRDYTRGVGQQRCGDGWLWMVLGYFLYQHGVAGVQAQTAEEHTVPNEGVWCWLEGAARVLRAYRELAKHLGRVAAAAGTTDPLAAALDCDDLLDGTQLTEPEVAEVQRGLLEALHVQCVMVRARAMLGRSPAVDLLTWRGADFDPEQENLHLGALQQAHAAHAGFMALYLELDVPDKAVDPLRVQFLTHIPRDICLQLGRDNEQEFPWCCETIYPLH